MRSTRFNDDRHRTGYDRQPKRARASRTHTHEWKIARKTKKPKNDGLDKKNVINPLKM